MIRKVEWRDMKDLVDNYYSYYDEVVREDPDLGLIFHHDKPDLESEVTWFSTLFREVLANNAVAVVAEEDGGVVGICDVHRNRPGSEMSHIGVLGMAIRKEYRDKGIGTKLITAVIEECKGKYEIVVLGVFAKNDRAMHLYNKLGFVEYGRLPRGIKRDSRYYDEIHMYKVL